MLKRFKLSGSPWLNKRLCNIFSFSELFFDKKIFFLKYLRHEKNTDRCSYHHYYNW